VYIYQTGFYAASINRLAQWLVDLRHQATHNQVKILKNSNLIALKYVSLCLFSFLVCVRVCVCVCVSVYIDDLVLHRSLYRFPDCIDSVRF
jgi:hypothetical protein